ncbi:MAG: substrate-binding domain-containing protein [Cyanobacteria bacterium P01_A01_bin.84]
MWQKEKKDSLIVRLALLLALATTPVAAIFFVSESAFAQSSETTETTSFPLPENVPSGTTVRIDSSNSMAEITQALKQSFEKKYSSTNVKVSTNDANKAIKSVINGDVDIAAIGRNLTPEEEKQGLKQVRLRREKIAIIVSKDNTFNKSLTNDQFARIFRGEITDWSELGGSPGKIRLIDYPDSSETRGAFRNYPVFKKAKFATGATASQLENDNVAEAVKKLGKDGISYVISNQVSKLDDVRVLPMHKILPDDARYPYSQSLVYVYKKNSANNPSVKSFLGFAIAPIGKEIVEETRTAQAVAVANQLTGNSDGASSINANTETNDTDKKQNGEDISGDVSNPQNSAGETNTENTNTQLNVNTNGDSKNSSTATEVEATNSTTTNTADGKLARISGESDSANDTEPKLVWWWLLLPAAILGALFFWLLANKKKRDPNSKDYKLETNPDTPIVGTNPNGAANPSLEGSTAVQTKVEENVSDDSNVALATGAAGLAGTALLANSTATNSDTQNENVVDETGGLDLEAPAAIVHNFHPQVDDVSAMDSATDSDLPIPEQLSDTTSENETDNTETEDKPNLLGNIVSAGDAAAAAGAALAAGAGASLWSRFSNKEKNNQQDAENPNPQAAEVSETEEIATNQSSAESSDTSNQTGNSWLDSLKSKGNAAVAGGTILAAGAAGAAANLWSKSEGDSQQDSPQNSEENNSDIEETTNPAKNTVAGTELPVVQINSTSPSVSEITDNEILETDKVVDGSELPVVNITNPVTEESQVDVNQPGSSPGNQSGNQLNLVDNLAASKDNAGIPLTGVDKTIAGGAAVVAGAGAALWSNLSNQDSNQDAEHKTQASVTEDAGNNNQTTDIPSNVSAASHPLPDLWTSQEETQTETSLQTPENISIESNSRELDEVANAAEPLTENTNTDNTQEIQDTIPSDIESEIEKVDTAQTTPAETSTIDPATLAGVAGVGTAGIAALAGLSNQDAASTQTNIILESRTPKWAYASWDLSTADRQEVHANGDSQLMLRLYDVTDIDLSYQSPNLVQQYECEQTINHRYVAIPKSDRNYMAEVGYITQDQRWQSLARSQITRVFSRPQEGFWFEADAELIIHGATEPGSDVSIAGSPVTVKPDGTFHLRVPFTQELIDYLIVASNPNGNNAKTVHMKFRKESE